MSINLKMDKIELQYILESLLFACSSDVCAEWYKEDAIKLLEISKKIKQNNPDIILKNVFIHNPSLSSKIIGVDDNTPDIIETFPEILKENII